MRIVVLVGSPGVGKTEVAERMLQFVEGWDYLAVGKDGGMREIAHKLEAIERPTILECEQLTPILRKIILGHDVTIIQVYCTEEERARRLGLPGTMDLGRPIRKQQHHKEFCTTGGNLPDSHEAQAMAGRPSGQHARTGKYAVVGA